MKRFDVPIVFCIFNRLDTTKKVFKKIRRVKPQKLYLISDAPRDDRPMEEERVQEVRLFVEDSIDWECEVHKNYAEKNMGCGKRLSSGISWVFETEERAIILEDDIIPDDTFFFYCEEMLEYYKDNKEILMISGNNPIEELYSTDEDYLFSKVPFIWGWATWRRAWNIYDFKISSWPQNRKNPVWKKVFPLNAYWTYTSQFDVLYSGDFNDTWSYQFMYAGIINDMLCVLPSKSHTFNIGFQEESTHTKSVPKWMSNNSSPVKFPIKHRIKAEWDRDFDKIYMTHFGQYGLTIKIKHMLGFNINKPIKEEISNWMRKR